jgi:hypothetical protein
MANQAAITGSFNECKRSMARAVALGLLASAASAAPGEVAEAGYRWTVRNQEQAAPVTGGVFRAGAQRARLTLDAPLEANTRLTLAARVSKNGGVRLSTGRRDECLAISVAFGEAPTIQCSYTDPSGNVPMRRTLRVGGVAKPNFGWTDTLLDWLEHYRGLEAAQPLETRWLQLALELRGGRCRFLLDGRLLHEWTPTEDLYGNRPAVDVDPGADVRVPEIRRLTPEDPLHLPLDISAGFNAAGLTGEALDPASLPARGAEFAVGGIPFVLGEAAKAGCDNLDVGLSWFREGNLTSYEEPHNGSFGGRWAGSASGNPTRFQFPLPQRAITALHLLAASESKPDAIPRLTAQFYRPAAGSPKNFVSPDVPLATAAATASAALPVKTASGKTLHLWRVTIPVEPGLLQEFEDLDVLEVELTKDVQIFRAYPDPNHYSFHAAGLPSSVRVFAMTLGVAPVAVRFEPEALGNVWVESAPAYRVTARNNTSQPKDVTLDIRAVSHDGSETNHAERTLTLPPDGEKTVRFDLPLKRYGHHAVALQATCDGTVQTHARTLSRLRRRETTARTLDAKGFMFGYWNWRGGHHTPGEADELRLMGALGMESTGPNPGSFTTDPEMIALARRYGIKSYWTGGRWATAGNYLEDPAKSINELETRWREYGRPSPAATHEPTYINLFAEPGGLGTHGVLPEFYGDPPFKMNEEQQKAFKRFHATALASAEIARKWSPGVKILFPWGDPSFAIPFLQADDKLTKLMDGVGVDIGYFDRVPEMQMHQCALHRTYQFTTYWKQFKKAPPVWPAVEGPCIAPALPGALTPQQQADHFVRAALILGAYGVNRQFSMGAPADCAGWWGEQHYGGGLLSRLSGLNPHPAYSAVGTLIRNLRHMEFAGWVPTGSLSVYCLQFRDSRDGKSLYVLWTLRGRRGVTVALPKGAAAEWIDDMDNSQRLTASDAGVSLTLSPSPGYLYGAGEAPRLTLGEPDHGDSVPGPHVRPLGSVADLFATPGDDADPEYVDSFPDAIRRFPAVMQLARTNAPAAQGGTALAVTLPPQSKDRGVMPFYTALKPASPVVIPGKGQYLTLWVRAASDWGRLVYVLRDAKGEKWTSVGTVGEWNSDDTPCASAFNFDGWRLLRFELPSHAPYDSFRELGTTWWGSSGGDAVVDLPLSIEKLFIERRPKAMYVNSLEPADPAPVLLGDLAVEYASAADQGDEAVARSRVRMPPPPAGSPRVNPIAALAAAGTLPAGAITAVEQPAHYYDGTRGLFSFAEIAEAVHYDIWLARHADGRDALKLGSRLVKSGAQVGGFRAGTDFYAFLVYTDKAGAVSKPSAPFKFRLENQFGMR